MTRMLCLGDLCEIRSGGTPSRAESTFFGGSIPWVKIGDLNVMASALTTTEECLTEEGLRAIRGRVFPAGSILLAMYGSVGKIAVAGTDVATSQAILGIQVRDENVLNARYLRRWLAYIQPKLMHDARGVTQLNISATYIRGLRIPVPPLEEQSRVAAILDNGDGLVRKRRESSRLAASLLPAIFQGMFGDAVRNERCWKIVDLAELIDPRRPITYGIVLPGPEIPGGVPYVRVIDLAGGTVRSHGLRHTTELIAQSYGRSALRSGDLLMSIRGHVGRLAVVPSALNGANLTQDTARLSLLAEYEVEYVSACLSTFAMQRLMQRFVKGVAVTGINLSDVRKLPVPVPPKELRHQFALLARAHTELRRAVDQHLRDSERLFESLASEVFAGLPLADSIRSLLEDAS